MTTEAWIAVEAILVMLLVLSFVFATKATHEAVAQWEEEHK